MEPGCLDEVVSFSEPSLSGLSVHSKNPFLPSVCFNTSSDWEELVSPYLYVALKNVFYSFCVFQTKWTLSFVD
ncbi:unnamed protein product [Gongylonema pulchrum]|uniref:Ovule protein n=1 Tax=Gongylonema pulchrum TaxID=637853 RepID=A0A183EH42_9BILA|nr:unnamed protein product [Gongylonema pulchrum]